MGPAPNEDGMAVDEGAPSRLQSQAIPVQDGHDFAGDPEFGALLPAPAKELRERCDGA